MPCISQNRIDLKHPNGSILQVSLTKKIISALKGNRMHSLFESSIQKPNSASKHNHEVTIKQCRSWSTI